MYMLETLGVIRRGNLDVGAQFTTLQLEQLFYNHEPEATKRNYRHYTKQDFNSLIRGYNHQYMGRAKDLIPDTLRSVLSLILKSFFDYEVVRSPGYRKKVHGRSISSFSFQPRNRTKNQPHPPCILSIIKQEWPDDIWIVFPFLILFKTMNCCLYSFITMWQLVKCNKK